MNYFQRKVILLTGATGGLGTEMTRQLSSTGAKLILTDIREDLQHRNPQILAYLRADLGTREGCEELLKRCANISPNIDMLINNAGLATVGCFVDVPDDKWEAQVNVNLIAPMTLTKLILPGMISRRSGHIVNISSVGGHVASPTS